MHILKSLDLKEGTGNISLASSIRNNYPRHQSSVRSRDKSMKKKRRIMVDAYDNTVLMTSASTGRGGFNTK
jgi:uncharacterized membrane protein (UPF0182 family)